MPRVSVILSIFDQPVAFGYALLGFARQSFRDFEIVVADDGSDEETRAVVDAFRARSALPVKHVWQENKGFRRAKIANTAVRASEGRILLLANGDCIPHADFVRTHAERCPPGGLCGGGYVRLSAAYSRSLSPEKVEAGDFEAQLTAAERRRFRWKHWHSSWGLFWGKIRRPKIYGCNMSVDRDAFYAVNGFDENFDGFGKEDSDLRDRLRRHGARGVSVWDKTWVFHVDDAIDPKIRARRVPRKSPYEYYAREGVSIRCENGLVKP